MGYAADLMKTRFPLEMATLTCFLPKGVASARPLWLGNLAVAPSDINEAVAAAEVIAAHAIANRWLGKVVESWLCRW